MTALTKEKAEQSDLDILRSAQHGAMKVLSGWHLDAGEDVTRFEGYSLGRIYRIHLVDPVVRMFRQAAKGVDPESPAFWDDDFSRKYRPSQTGPSFQTRRTDLKGTAFRTLYRTVAAFRPSRTGKSVLMAGTTPNMAMWTRWLLNPKDTSGIYLDFMLTQAPELRFSLQSVVRCSRVFDPPVFSLSAAQKNRVSEIRQALARLFRNSAWKNHLQFNGLDLSGLFRQQVAQFENNLDHLAAKCAAFDVEFTRIKPDLIFIGEETSVDVRIFYFLSKKHGVPVWFLNHGFPGIAYHYKDYPACGELEANLILAWGEEDKDNYERAGVQKARIAVTGNPGFDRYLPPGFPKPFQRVAAATVLVTALSTPAPCHTVYYDDSQERYFREVPQLLSDMGAKEIFFKFPKPGPRVEYYRELLNSMRLKCPISLLQDEDFGAVLERSDFAVGHITTAIFQTLLAGKDYFPVSYDPYSPPPPFNVENSCVAKSARELEKNLLAGNPAPREKILREFCNVHGGEETGHFSRRVLRLISGGMR